MHDLQMKHPSLVSENLRFSESGITTAEVDSTLPNPMEFMQALVQCDSEQNSRCPSPGLKRPPIAVQTSAQRNTNRIPPNVQSKVLQQHQNEQTIQAVASMNVDFLQKEQHKVS